MENKNLELLKELTTKEINLEEVSLSLGISTLEVLNLIRLLRKEGINIVSHVKDDGIYIFNQGEQELTDENSYKFVSNTDNEFKFVAISDTRFGSKSQQLSILNDIYSKAYSLGFNNVILCGNLTEGLYPMNDKYSKCNFLDDTLRQVDYVAEYYPYIDGMKTYFITGAKDEKHLKDKKINVGKRVSDLRTDMIYLGNGSCNVFIDKAQMLVFSPKLYKTYTVSYRPQQQIDSFRSEDKPDILLYGGLLQMEKFTYRQVKCISVPSVCATTKEMNDKRYSNTIGAWYITLKMDRFGNLKKLNAMNRVYYKTNKDDYLKPKALKLTKGGK